ncbi:MAG: hypothetical protein ACREP2_10660 [Rhodanobacteraceae bacterium]
MYSGWIYKFKINRPITEDEEREALFRERQDRVEASDRGSLTRFNSTYVEFIDRCFSLRGSMGILICVSGLVFFIGVVAFAVQQVFTDGGDGHWIAWPFLSGLGLGFGLMTVRLALGKEFFT